MTDPNNEVKPIEPKKVTPVFGTLDNPTKKIINEEIKQKDTTQSILG